MKICAITFLLMSFVAADSARSQSLSWTHVGSFTTPTYDLTVGHDGSIVANTIDSLFLSSDGGAHWSSRTSFALHFNALGDMFFIPPSTFFGSAGTYANGSFHMNLYRAAAGSPWDSVLAGSTGVIRSNSSGRIFVGTFTGLRMSADSGATWQLLNNGLPADTVDAIYTQDDGLLLAAVPNHGIYRSTDNGNSWLRCSSAVSDSSWTYPEFSAGPFGKITLLAPDTAARVRYFYSSSDRGDTWTPVSSTPRNVYYLHIGAAGTFYALSHDMIFPTCIFSTDNGNHWDTTMAGLAYQYIYSMTMTPDGHLIIGAGGGVFISTSSILTSVPSAEHSVPAGFTLNQNYPNPFNPSTTISFTIRERGRVTLEVFDLLGHRVAQLVDGVREPGRYSATFAPSNLPSGVYFCKLAEGSASLTRRLLFLK